MAQAIDLPNPLNDKSAGANNADDLLAQLAGAEVDRLLSEADIEALHPNNVDRAPEAETAVATEQPTDPTDAALDDLFNQLNAAEIAVAQKAPVDPVKTEPASAPAVEAAQATSIEDAITQRAQDLIEQAKREAGEGVALEAATSQAAQEPSAADALAAEMEADEQQHLAAMLQMNAPTAEPTTLIDEDQVESLAARHDAEEPQVETTPIVVSVLEWLNAPLANLSIHARQSLGKVALVTTFNALAILIYVLMFRRH